MRVTEKEIESVSRLEPFERYKYLLNRVADFQVMYALKSGNEWAVAEVEGCEVFSIWSAKEFVLLNASGEWEGYKASEIGLDAFEDEIIPILESKGYLLNVFSVNGKSGLLVELDEFIRDLKAELRNYE